MENEVKVVRGFAVSMCNDYVEFFNNIEDAKKQLRNDEGTFCWCPSLLCQEIL